MIKTFTKSEYKTKIKELKEAVWQYLIDHSTKDVNLESFKIIFTAKDRDYFWKKVKVRQKGYYCRKDIKKEQENLDIMIAKAKKIKLYHKIRNRKIEKFNKSKKLSDIFVKILIRKLIKYRENKLNKYDI